MSEQVGEIVIPRLNADVAEEWESRVNNAARLRLGIDGVPRYGSNLITGEDIDEALLRIGDELGSSPMRSPIIDYVSTTDNAILMLAIASNYGYVMDDGALSDKIVGREIKGGSF